MRSLSEIETVSKRASRAAGFSWGEAEEIGKNIRLLEMFGFSGIKTLSIYLLEKKQNNFQNLKLLSDMNNTNDKLFCPISIGINFLDQAETIKHNKITFNKAGYPLLILPFLSRSSEIIGKKIELKFNQMKFILNMNLSIYSNCDLLNQTKEAQNIEINFLENRDNFSESDWKNLYSLSEETFVEETDSLKQSSAGAGLTDND